ncbi:hypothetical protein B0H67DRAFT_143609 [Lasiosphaeris hirsuta]|uniref:Uncharacterized protein n=1 Tax=Lasiosphaeris hirsuta TaxID=260670 RepID=A0AA40E837_9PEZI|nr:hypothetical protein B0H67DRAFT_143609 [Lasiosphaeris hirsuta]
MYISGLASRGRRNSFCRKSMTSGLIPSVLRCSSLHSKPANPCPHHDTNSQHPGSTPRLLLACRRNHHRGALATREAPSPETTRA